MVRRATLLSTAGRTSNKTALRRTPRPLMAVRSGRAYVSVMASLGARARAL
jgi:hypothetical protein